MDRQQNRAPKLHSKYIFLTNSNIKFGNLFRSNSDKLESTQF